MVRRHRRLIVMAGIAIAVLAVGTVVALGQQRTNSGLPPGPGNPLAALQQQIDVLTQQIANLSGTGIQGAAESNLVVVRGTIHRNPLTGNSEVLAGAGFTVANPMTVFCGTNPYPTYQVVFDGGTFSAPPSVVVSAHDFIYSPADDPGNHPVYTVAIVGGNISQDGFDARIKTDGFLGTCFGSQVWDFIAIGPH